MKVRLANGLTAILIAAVFLLDCIAPSNWSISRFYLPCILLTYTRNCDRAPLLIAGLCSVLTLIGPVLNAQGAPSGPLLASHVPDLLLFWIVAGFVVLMNRSTRERMRLAADIEQQRVELEAQKALRQSEIRFRELTDRLPQIIFTAAPDGAIDHLNARSTEYTGIDAKDLTGWSWEKVVHPDDLQQTIEGWSQAVKSGTPDDRELRIRRRDGVYRWFICRQIPSFAPDGTITRWHGACTDIEDRIQMESALRASQANLANAQRIAHLGSWTWDLTTNKVTWSDEVHRIYGTDPQTFEPTYEYFLSSIHPDDRDHVTTQLQRSIVDETDYDVEYRIFRPDGREIALHTRGELGFDSAGQAAGMSGTVVDVTARKQTERALEKNQDQLKLIFDSVAEGLIVEDAEKGIIECNSEAGRILGLKSEQLIGQTSYDPRVHLIRENGQRVEQVDLPVVATFRTGKPARDAVLGIPKANGQTVWLSVNTAPLFDTSGRVTMVVTSFSDITENKRADARLRTTEKRLATILDACPIGICITTLESGIILDVNDPCCEIAGYTRDEVLGRAIMDLGFWPELTDRPKFIQRLIAEGTIKNLETPFRRKDGSIGHALRSFERLMLDGQECILTMLTDITDRKQIDEELRTSRGRLEVLTRQLISTQETERRRLARELHDEIGQLLTAIKMSLRRSQQAADASLQLNLDENVQMIETAIGQVRNLSLSLRPPQLDELGLVAALHWLIKHQARIGGFQEHLEVGLGDHRIPEELATICFRIVQETLTNAIRHAHPTSVSVKVIAENDELYLQVQDDGVGFNVDEARQRAMSGASLGLLSMQERVSLVGGRLQIDSEVGQGTRIQIWFQLKPT